MLSGIPNIHKGATTKSKLLARKRPLLVPIYDTVVRDLLGLKDSGGFWAGMRHDLMSDDKALYHRAEGWCAYLELGETVTPLRALDVVMWRAGKRG